MITNKKVPIKQWSVLSIELNDTFPEFLKISSYAISNLSKAFSLKFQFCKYFVNPRTLLMFLPNLFLLSNQIHLNLHFLLLEHKSYQSVWCIITSKIIENIITSTHFSKQPEIPTISCIIFWDFSMFYKIFLSPQVKRWVIITYKHGIYELPHEFLNNLGLRILGN